jgi:membrane associated rhomboid family serine protease
MQNLTLIIIILTSGCSIYCWSNPAVLNKFIFNPYQIVERKEYYRLITSGFIHADWSHLIFNMMSFYFFGRHVEFYFEQIFGEAYGSILYLALYFFGIMLSDLPSLFAHKGSHLFNSLGASGGVSSVIYACILFSPLDKIYIFFIPIGIPGFIYGFIYLIYCSYANNMSGQKINHSAHLWGSIFGVVFTIIVYPPVIIEFYNQISSWI